MSLDPPPIPPAQAALILGMVKSTPTITHYTELTSALGLVREALYLLWLWIVLQAGIAKQISAWSSKNGRNLILAAAIFWTAYHALTWLMFLPLSLYDSYRLPHLYGLSNQSIGAWFHDDLIGWLVDTLVGAFLVGAMLWFVKRTPVRWPFWFAAIMIPLIAFGIFVTPLVIDPLYNKFTPLPQTSPLRAGIERLAAKAGIPHADIFVVDKSKQTNETNAYVTGLGSTARIVIWDTMIKKTTPAQLDAVVSHEMGHYVEHHVTIGFWLTCASLFIVLPIARWMCLALLKQYGGRWGASNLHEPAAIPVILLVVSLIGIVTDPVSEAASRYIEHRADAFGLALCGDRAAMATAFIALSRDDLSMPYPPAWIELLDSHPSLGDRIQFALYGEPSQEWPVGPMIPH